jgi:hypothetical protein
MMPKQYTQQPQQPPTPFKGGFINKHMKNAICILLLFFFVACEDQSDVTYRYLKPFDIAKDYPIILDANHLLVDIQVKLPANPDAAFKIVSNDNYYFVGEKMKGIHVYQKTGEYQTTPLCFIECIYLKAFDVKDNMLYCNNFVDLLVIDVENPLQAKIKHREKYFFNSYENGYYNFPTYAGMENRFIVGYKQVALSGTLSQNDPFPDFSEYDKLYYNLIVSQIPDSLQVEKPYVAFANIEGKMYTFGYNSLGICTYSSGSFSSTPTAIRFPGYLPNSIYNLHCKDSILYFFTTNKIEGYDYSSEKLIDAPGLHYWERTPIDVVKLST